MDTTFPHSTDAAARRDLRRSVRIGAACAVFFSTWAFLANLSHGVASGVMAALTQAGLSFVLSFFCAEGIHFCERRLGTTTPALVVTALGPTFLADGVIALTHALARTPEILRTMAPGVVTGAVSGCLYIVWRMRARAAAAL